MAPAYKHALIGILVLGGCTQHPSRSGPAAKPATSARAPTPREPSRAGLPPPTRAELIDAIKALEHCQTRPYVDPPELEAEESFVTLLRGREQSIDLLLDAITDTRVTQVGNFFGGRYKVGDLAWHALASLVPGLPLMDESGSTSPRAKECGECALWDEVALAGGRERLQRRLRAWFDAHRQELEWVEIAGYPAGGRFRIREGGTL